MAVEKLTKDYFLEVTMKSIEQIIDTVFDVGSDIAIREAHDTLDEAFNEGRDYSWNLIKTLMEWDEYTLNKFFGVDNLFDALHKYSMDEIEAKILGISLLEKGVNDGKKKPNN